MSKTPKKDDSKKGLGRGLGDLLAQHDTDLPFLGAYGAASGEQSMVYQHLRAKMIRSNCYLRLRDF